MKDISSIWSSHRLVVLRRGRLRQIPRPLLQSYGLQQYQEHRKAFGILAIRRCPPGCAVRATTRGAFARSPNKQGLRGVSVYHNMFAFTVHVSFRYIKALYAYLLGFTKRTQPLVDVDTRQKAAEAAFDLKWSEGTVLGWEGVSSSSSVAPAANGGTGIWCSACKLHFFRCNTVCSYVMLRRENVLETNRL
jgi:hypothetical protein